MEKVKLTQEQAELMEEVRGCASVSELCYERCLNGSWIGVFKPLNELNADEFARALYIGYEVIPNFKVGDWCYNPVNDLCCQITKINGIEVWGDWYGDGSKTWSFKDSIRHATPEEIAEEKERRWWRKLDRDVDEYKEGDIILDGIHGYMEVDTILSDYDIEVSNAAFITETDIDQVVLVCRAEDRKDVKE